MATIDVGLFYYTDKFKQLTRQELAGRRIGYDSAVMGHETLNKLRLLVPDSQLMPLNPVRGGDVAAIMMTTHFGQATLNYLNLGHQFKQVINFNYGLDIYILGLIKKRRLYSLKLTADLMRSHKPNLIN
jgi:hypothetical protein